MGSYGLEKWVQKHRKVKKIDFGLYISDTFTYLYNCPITYFTQKYPAAHNSRGFIVYNCHLQIIWFSTNTHTKQIDLEGG